MQIAQAERRFYTGMAVLSLVVVLIGFGRSYDARLTAGPPMTPLVYVHAALFVGVGTWSLPRQLGEPDASPDGIEIQRSQGATQETVWTYSDSRAAAKALSRKDLAETFGFDPTLWGQSG